MNTYEQEYLKHKEDVLACLQEAEDFFREFGYEEEAQAVQDQAVNLKNGEFTIVLVGEFSAGKSTFLNALMGERILPSFTNETTATINFLKHKNKAEDGESGCVYFYDGTKKKLGQADFETISKYVSTDSSEDVAKRISHLDLYLDSKFLENNVTLVDSPGLNGVADGHREITEAQIARSSASIFLFNAKQPGSHSDFEFLRNLQKRVKSIICVLNQIDCIKKTEGQTVESVIQKLKENYKKQIPDAQGIPEIFPTAAYPALVARGSAKMEYNGKTEFSEEEKQDFEKMSRMQEFEDRLWRFLTQGEKAKQELMAPADQLEAQLISIKERKKSELNLLEGKTDAGELEQQQLELEKQKEKLEDTMQEKSRDIQSDLKQACKELIEEVNAESERLKKRYLDHMDQWTEIEDIETDKIRHDLEKALEQISQDAFDGMKEHVADMIVQYSGSIMEDIDEQLADQSFQITIRGEIEEQNVFLGIEKYENEAKELEEQIRELDEKSDRLDSDLIQAMKKEQKRAALEEKLERIKNMKEQYEETSALCIPERHYSVKKERSKKPSEGIFGFCKKIFVGNGYEWIDVPVVDSEDRDAYIKERNAKIKRYDHDIYSQEKEIEKLEKTDVSVDELEHQRKRLEAAMNRKQAELDALRNAFKIKSDSQIKKGLRKQKAAVCDFIDENVHNFTKMFRKEFKDRQNVAATLVMDVIAGKIKAQIDTRKKEIEMLQEKAKTAMESREAAVALIQKELASLEELLEKALDLKSALDEIQVDAILEESL